MRRRFRQVAIASTTLAACAAAYAPPQATQGRPARGARLIGTPVYVTEFDKRPGKEWSSRNTSATPRKQTFLGPFTAETATLKLADLPEHRFVILRFELYVIRSWDGSVKTSVHTPDIFEVAAAGQTLLSTTFSNCPWSEELGTQAYPGEFPHDRVKAHTGAAQIDTLGYTFTFGAVGQKKCDSVYRIDLLFGHRDKTLTVDFTGKDIQEAKDESWGLGRVQVHVLKDAPFEMKKDALEACWDGLAKENVPGRMLREQELVGAGDASVAFLAKKLKAHPAVNAERAAKLIAQLDATGFRQREKATKALIRMGPPVAPLLRARKPGSAEAAARIKLILRKLSSGTLEGDALRRGRAIRVLQRINTPDARKLLAEIGGASDADASK